MLENRLKIEKCPPYLQQIIFLIQISPCLESLVLHMASMLLHTVCSYLSNKLLFLSSRLLHCELRPVRTKGTSLIHALTPLHPTSLKRAVYKQSMKSFVGTCEQNGQKHEQRKKATIKALKG